MNTFEALWQKPWCLKEKVILISKGGLSRITSKPMFCCSVNERHWHLRLEGIYGKLTTYFRCRWTMVNNWTLTGTQNPFFLNKASEGYSPPCVYEAKSTSRLGWLGNQSFKLFATKWCSGQISISNEGLDPKKLFSQWCLWQEIAFQSRPNQK